MESGDPQASIESLVRALVAAGGQPELRVGVRKGFAAHEAVFVKTSKRGAARKSA